MLMSLEGNRGSITTIRQIAYSISLFGIDLLQFDYFDNCSISVNVNKQEDLIKAAWSNQDDL